MERPKRKAINFDLDTVQTRAENGYGEKLDNGKEKR